WVCGEWSDFHGWLYIISDIFIGLAYTGIPIIILIYVWKKNKNVPFQHIFLLFGAFILFCGLTHFMDAIIFWWPAYRLSALIRFFTAVVSIATLIALYKILPDIFSLKTSAQFKHELEQRIIAEERLRAKNEELTLANRDLESFTYSVSHDLRAPLRAINTYSSFLNEDNYEQLDEQGKKYVNNIRVNSQKTEALILDLLRFSRVSQRGLNYAAIDMNKMVNELVDNVKRDYQKPLKIEIEKLPEIYADAALIRQLMENLISNAFKYSNKTENPEIQIGVINQQAGKVFFVKDNGIGFDMKYYDKIFQVFQRVHSEADYDGTGVGMAIAKRIVEKHGGEIWAEGKVHEGAIFYFSIPNKPG
ncbi:MAG: GHKL domain-containing protein, partial [Bacteroidetes bacterium]|nr:GHKL domain-containing protein [Bacteroidota bacterium]